MAINQALLDLQKRLEQSSSKFVGNRVKYVTVKEGQPVTFSVLWDTSKEHDFWCIRGTHYLTDDLKVDCPKECSGEPCPICDLRNEYFEQLKQKKDEKQELQSLGQDTTEVVQQLEILDEIVDTLKPNKKFCLNVLVSGDNTISLYSAPWTVFEKILEQVKINLKGGDFDPINILDPYNSYRFTVNRTSESGNIRYNTSIAVRSSPLISNPDGTPNESAIAKLIESMIDFPTYFKPIDPVEVQSVLDKYLNPVEETKSKGNVLQQPAKIVEQPQPVLQRSPEVEKSAAIESPAPQQSDSSRLAQRLRSQSTKRGS